MHGNKVDILAEHGAPLWPIDITSGQPQHTRRCLIEQIW